MVNSINATNNKSLATESQIHCLYWLVLLLMSDESIMFMQDLIRIMGPTKLCCKLDKQIYRILNLVINFGVKKSAPVSKENQKFIKR